MPSIPTWSVHTLEWHEVSSRDSRFRRHIWLFRWWTQLAYSESNFWLCSTRPRQPVYNRYVSSFMIKCFLFTQSAMHYFSATLIMPSLKMHNFHVYVMSIIILKCMMTMIHSEYRSFLFLSWYACIIIWRIYALSTTYVSYWFDVLLQWWAQSVLCL